MKNFFNNLWQTKSKTSAVIAMGNVGKAVWTPRCYGALAREGYMTNPIVYRCVSLIAKGAASVPWKLFQNDHEVCDHSLLDLLHHPNPLQGGASFISSVMSYYLLAGNSYLEAITDHEGKVRELYALRPDRMKVVPDEHGIPLAYQYTINGNTQTIYQGSNQPILHLRAFHPTNDWYGMSPLEAAARAIDQNNAVSAHNLSILQNGGRPSGALKINTNANMGRMNDEQIETLRQDLKDSYEGVLNAGKIMVLEGDFDWQEMGLSPKDLDFVEGKKLSSREIAQSFGVPSMLVGIPGDSTFANYREARYHHTIIPLLDMLCDELNHWLTPRFGSNLKLVFNLEAIPALSVKRENMWKSMNEVKFLTVNEKRKMMGYHPMPNTDSLVTEINDEVL